MTILHASTNNGSKTTPQELCKEVVETLVVEEVVEIQKNIPRSKIAFSAAFRRSDSNEPSAKITPLNDLLREELPQQGFEMIDNSNILFSSLEKDGLK